MTSQQWERMRESLGGGDGSPAVPGGNGGTRPSSEFSSPACYYHENGSRPGETLVPAKRPTGTQDAETSAKKQRFRDQTHDDDVERAILSQVGPILDSGLDDDDAADDTSSAEQLKADEDEGIFDDAEEAFNPLQLLWQTGSDPSTAPTTLSTSAKKEYHVPDKSPSSTAAKDFLSKVNKKKKKKKEGGGEPDEQEKREGEGGSDKEEPEKKPPKRKRAKPTRKVLVASKERDQAMALLRGKTDLSDCLPARDCDFLGEECWIFTVEQLEFALTPSVCHDELLKKLQASTFLRPVKDGEDAEPTVQTKEEESKATGPSSLDAPIPSASEERNNSASSEQKDTVPMDTTTDSLKPAAILPIIENPETNDTGRTETEEAETKAAPELGVGDEDDLLQAAHGRLQTWRGSIEKFRSGGSQAKPVEERFLLTGAIRCLLPVATRNFIASLQEPGLSVPVKTVFDFMSLKKTETGVILDILTAWRKDCGLPALSGLGLAKHLLSVATRIEIALSSVPPISGKERLWNNDPLMVMTGAAKEFLLDSQSITSASRFLEMRTKGLSEALAQWREKKGLPPLKGSGKVAMVSSWKAAAKEAVQAQEYYGRVLTGVDFEALVRQNIPEIVNQLPEAVQSTTPPPPTKKKKKAKKEKSRLLERMPDRAISTTDRSVEYALHSNLFLADALGNEIARLVSTAGIETAAELFDADTSTESPLYRTLLEAKWADCTTEFIYVVDEWRRKLRQDLDELGKKSSQDEPAKPKPPPSSTSRRVRRAARGSEDPFDCLSALTKKFLGSMGISTAEQFLSTRTTDIANEFVKWRVAEGKPELKGLGAIASTSGWKALVRKKAKAMGLDELSEMEPEGRVWSGPKTTPVRSKTSSAGVPKAPVFPPELAAKVDRSGRKVFAVQSEESARQFVFELSLRKPENDDRAELFISYKRSSRGQAETDHQKVQKILLQDSGLDIAEASTRYPILSNTNVASTDRQQDGSVDSRDLFSSTLPGCGLVDVSTPGVYPLHGQDLTELKDKVKHFVCGTKEGHCLGSFAEGNHNVLVRKVGHDKYQLLLYLQEAIEKGQTLRLRLPTVGSVLGSNKYRDSEFQTRHVLEEAFHVLSVEDLRTILTWLKEEVLGLTGYSATHGTDHEDLGSFKKACENRRRLHWVSRRVAAAIEAVLSTEAKFRASQQARLSDGDLDCLAELYFGRKMLVGGHELTQQKKDCFSSALAAQVAEEMHSSLELDAACCTSRRSEWCPKAVDLFESLIRILGESYSTVSESQSNLLPCLEGVLKGKVHSSYFTDIEHLDEFVLRLLSESPTGDGEDDAARLAFDRIRQRYEEAMRLCGEDPHSLPKPARLDVVACIDKPASSGTSAIKMRRPKDVRDERATLSSVWYRELFWKIAFKVVTSFSFFLDQIESDFLNLDDTLFSVKQVLLENNVRTRNPPAISYELPLAKPSAQVTAYYPESFQFFLGLVWPTLHKQGWCLDAGSSPSDVTFLPPGRRILDQRQARSLKKERDRGRAKLARQVNLVGHGSVSKLSKRLFVSVSSVNKEVEGSNSSRVAAPSVCVKQALNRFLGDFEKHVGEDSEILSRCTSIVEGIQNCFDELAPGLFPCDNEEGPIPLGRNPSDYLGNDSLLKFLLILPNLLRQADLPLQQMNETLEVAHELAEYLSTNHKELFDECFHIPHEEYVGQPESIQQSSLVAKLRRLQPSLPSMTGNNEKGEEAVNELTEVLLHEDRTGLSDFVQAVLEQAVPCRATEDDVRKKARRTTLGFPGLSCRHCMGSTGEGRYFFTSLESLTTATTVLEKHVLKCSLTPPEVKDKIRSAKLHHAEQRNQVKGGQAAFFSRLWDRLRSINIGGEKPSGLYVLESPASKKEKDSASASVDSSTEEFTKHVPLLEYVRVHATKGGNRELQQALNQYYACLEFAGRVYYTSSMPERFSPEWLLRKVMPRRRTHHETVLRSNRRAGEIMAEQNAQKAAKEESQSKAD